MKGVSKFVTAPHCGTIVNTFATTEALSIASVVQIRIGIHFTCPKPLPEDSCVQSFASVKKNEGNFVAVGSVPMCKIMPYRH